MLECYSCRHAQQLVECLQSVAAGTQQQPTLRQHCTCQSELLVHSVKEALSTFSVLVFESHNCPNHPS